MHLKVSSNGKGNWRVEEDLEKDKINYKGK